MNMEKIKKHCERFGYLHLGDTQKIYGVFIWETDEYNTENCEPTCQTLCSGGYREDIALTHLKEELGVEGLCLLVRDRYLYASISENLTPLPPAIAVKAREESDWRNV